MQNKYTVFEDAVPHMHPSPWAHWHQNQQNREAQGLLGNLEAKPLERWHTDLSFL